MKLKLRAEELRLLNIVGCKISNDAGVYHVLGFPDWTNQLTRPVIIDRCPKQVVGIDQLKPIKLTEEWLLKFLFHKDNYGVFEKTKDNTYTSRSEFELWMKKCKIKNKWVWDVSVGQNFGDTTNICFIQYVHQLQNIYFALTKKELSE